MSTMIQEVLRGEPGKVIREVLQGLIVQLDEATLRDLRNGVKPYDEVRYVAGYADGMRCALNTIADLAKDKSQ